MIIAINTIGLQDYPTDFDSEFLEELILFTAIQQTNDSFIFITNKSINTTENLPINCSFKIVKANSKSTLGLFYFSKITLPFLLKKVMPQIVIDIVGYGNVVTKIPQVVIAKNHKKKTLQKATQILAGSTFEKEQLLEKYQVLNSKFQIINGVANPIFIPLNYVESSITKDGYADGREYFLSVASHYSFDKFIDLLKAFSVFKRWQKSSMKLLIIGIISDHKNQLTEKLATYKYRDDIELLSTVTMEQQAKLFGASYGVLSIVNQSNFALPILQALQTNVPIISIENEALKSQFNETVLFVSDNDTDAVADKMKLLYRDENLRTDLITKGSQLITQFTYEKSSAALWQTLVDATK